MKEKDLPSGFPASLDEFVEQSGATSDEHYWPFVYTHQIGMVFSAICVVEETIIDALYMCENVVIDGRGPALPDVEAHYERKSILQGKTFGNLIRVLRENGVSEEGINYFTFVKKNRDKFIHRFFDDHHFPGDMNEYCSVSHIRDLRYFEIIFARAVNMVWKIIGREKYHELIDLGEDGFLLMNDIGKHLESPVETES